MRAKRTFVTLAFCACALVLLVGPAGATPGALDPAFGAGGIVTTAIGSSGSDADAIALQSDRKIVVGGSDGEFALARYQANGALDGTFGSGGTVTTAIGQGAGIRGIAVQPDGKIVAAGSTTIGSESEVAVARYNSDGSLDKSFGSGGTVVEPITSSGATVSALALQPDGKIVVGGVGGNGASFIARYGSDGSLDSGFASGGITPAIHGLTALALQPDGKIVATGAAYGYYEAERFNANGTPDEAFGPPGNAIAPSSRPGYGDAIAVQPDGKIVVAGHQGSGPGLGVIRWNADGTIDTGFPASDDNITVGSDTEAEALAVAVQPDGRIVLAGTAGSGSARDVLVLRLNVDGTEDTTFGNGGFVTTPVGSASSVANALALQPDGKLVVAGSTYNGNDFASQQFAVLRYLGDSVSSPVVPKLKGKTLAAAKGLLRTAGCPLGRVMLAYSKSVRKGRVIGQKPSAGSTCLRTVRVSLTVSKGKHRHR